MKAIKPSQWQNQLNTNRTQIFNISDHQIGIGSKCDRKLCQKTKSIGTQNNFIRPKRVSIGICSRISYPKLSIRTSTSWAISSIFCHSSTYLWKFGSHSSINHLASSDSSEKAFFGMLVLFIVQVYHKKNYEKTLAVI